MLLGGDWVLPVGAPPIREGGVLVRHGRIVEVGRFETLSTAHPYAKRVEHPGCMIVPGFVNAHTHLSLTALGGLIEPSEFPDWLSRVGRAVQKLGPQEFAASTVVGAHQCLLAGVTCVGDVAYGPEALAAAADAGLAGTFYWEILGITPDALPAVLSEREFPPPRQSCGTRTRCGLSAHTIYTAGPELISAVHRLAAERGLGFMMHAGESAAEVELLDTGEGRLAPVSQRLAVGFMPPGTGAIRYIHGLGALDGTVLIHCVHVRPDEFALLPRSGGVVLCPRSNTFLATGSAPVEQLLRSGATLALGTDSTASNEDLDLRAEARALREIVPQLPAATLLRMMTRDAAAVLGFGGLLGELSPGALADLTVIRAEASADPEEAVIASGSGTIEAVMTAGVWRVLHGRLCVLDSKARQDANRAARKAKAALA